MNLSTIISKHLRDVFFGGNWTSVNLRQVLSDVDWQTATKKIDGFNTIAALVYHIGYYISGVTPVFNGGELTTKDEFSFSVPEINSQSDWENMLSKTWKDVENLSALISELPDEKLHQPFVQEKYGSYYRNIAGIIEHSHYHLGQIVILKKML